jgi:hypothetical protein
MIESHYCLCGGQLVASGDAATVKDIAVMFWRSHEQAGHGPTTTSVAKRARVKAKLRARS